MNTSGSAAALGSVRLRAFEAPGSRDYTLNWLGSVRAVQDDSSRLEVFVRLAADRAVKDTWVSLEHFPVLVLGSRWRSGVMVGKAIASRTFSVLQPDPPTWHEPSRKPDDGRISFGEDYPLLMDNPASPVLEVPTATGEILLVPASEVLRAHYFSVHRAIPGILACLPALGRLSSPALEAWHPEGTFWIDEGSRHAQIHRSRFISDYQASCLAQLLFSREGLTGLHTIGHWAQQIQVGAIQVGNGARRIPLPRVLLPYPNARWRAVVRALRSDDAEEPSRFLVLQIQEIRVREPFETLTIVADDDLRGAEGALADDGSTSWFSKPLDPVPADPVSVEESPSDRGIAPVQLMDILPTNVSALQRRPLKPDPSIAVPGSKAHQFLSKSAPTLVDRASALCSGARGQGRAPLIYAEGVDDWPPRSPALRASLSALASGLDAWVLAHQRQRRSARWQPLPDPQHSYAYSIKRGGVLFGKPRQFLVVEVCVADTYAYLIDPERRPPWESFPMALLASISSTRPSLGRLDSSDIETLVRVFQKAADQRRSWISSPKFKDIYRVIPVYHPPREAPTAGQLAGFAKRVTDRLSTILGDPTLSP